MFKFSDIGTFLICVKPMALEQVLSDRDSEDEVDDDVADFEDRRVCFRYFYLSILGFTVVSF